MLVAWLRARVMKSLHYSRACHRRGVSKRSAEPHAPGIVAEGSGVAVLLDAPPRVLDFHRSVSYVQDKLGGVFVRSDSCMW